jgi:nitrogen regulatory protein PII
MKQIEAIVVPHLLDDVKERLCMVGVRGMTIHPVVFFDHVRASHPKTATTRVADAIRFLVVTTDDMAETVVNAILTVARRGQGTDGQILVVPVDLAVRIRTGETDEDSL